MKRGIDHEEPVGDVGIAPSDSFRMSREPRRGGILKGFAVVFEIRDADGEVEFSAMSAELFARGRAGHQVVVTTSGC